MIRDQLVVMKDFVPANVRYLTCGREYLATPIKGSGSLYLIKDDEGSILTVTIKDYDFHAGGFWQIVGVGKKVQDIDWNELIEGKVPKCLK
jgi:hypothetical protein